jgi:hypothetical protein
VTVFFPLKIRTHWEVSGTLEGEEKWEQRSGPLWTGEKQRAEFAAREISGAGKGISTGKKGNI